MPRVGQGIPIGQQGLQGPRHNLSLGITKHLFQAVIDEDDALFGIHEEQPFGQGFYQGADGDFALKQSSGVSDALLNAERGL